MTAVEENSPAYESGLRVGDVIREINHQPVTDANQAVRLSEAITDPTILLRVWGRGGSRFLVVDESSTS